MRKGQIAFCIHLDHCPLFNAFAIVGFSRFVFFLFRDIHSILVFRLVILFRISFVVRLCFLQAVLLPFFLVL